MAYVQFKDKTEKEIVSWFKAKPADDSEEKYLGEVADDDPRLLEFAKPFSEDSRAAMLTPMGT